MSRFASRALLWTLAVVIIGAFSHLGFWQLDRMHEKQAMLDGVHQVLQQRVAGPLSLAGSVSRQRGYDWAGGMGRFVDAPGVLLDNQSRADRAGVRAYRLFQPDKAQPDDGHPDGTRAMPLLVELGWQPMPGNRVAPDVTLPRGEMRIEGLLSPPPSHGLMAAVVEAQPNGTLLVTGLDANELPTLLRQTRLAPRVLMLDPRNPLGYARDLDILPNTLPPERHLGYAVQWFALAAAVLVTALVLTLRKPKPRTSPR